MHTKIYLYNHFLHKVLAKYMHACLFIYVYRLTVLWAGKRSSMVENSCWNSSETDTLLQISMSKGGCEEEEGGVKKNRTKFCVTCHTILSVLFYGTQSFCRQIKAKENKWKKLIKLVKKVISMSHVDTHQSTSSIILHYHVSNYIFFFFLPLPYVLSSFYPSLVM